ncbi:hypothetical protein Sjap_000685 [Stephania japonica]|uniref:Glucosidase 2 subunit beta n=1 Tax=Stephania japonica TaxID=461633 RepID=A0AAP0PSN8_9MAGN
MKPNLSFAVILVVFCSNSIFGSASTPRDFLGIPPQDLEYFKSDVIKCRDGSNKFAKAQLNDDFCDCADGTDEPGTPACPVGKFYCQNAGHVPLLLFSSRVNDGICDCCDGSDEYDSGVNCPNTCWEAGNVAREKLKKKIATFQEGVSKRKLEIEQAKQAITKDEAELSKLKKEEEILKEVVQQLKDHKEQIEKAEEKERLEKEREEKKKKESEEKINEEHKQSTEGHVDDHHETIGELDEHSHEQEIAEIKDELAVADTDDIAEHATDDHGTAKVEADISHDTEGSASPEHEGEQDKDVNTEGLSKEELGRLVASRWTGENTEQQPKEVSEAKEEKHEENPKVDDNSHDEDDSGYSSGMDEENHKYDEDEMDGDMDDDIDQNHVDSSTYDAPYSEDHDDFSDTISDSPSWLDKIQRTARNILQAVNVFRSPVDTSDAARVRKEYDESSAKLSKLRSRISSLTQKLKQDFGPEKEFYSFYDRCFEYKENKYTYKVCPFKQASQVEGHSTTRLGNWDKVEDSYKVMLFSNGDRCWNGPDRSLKVRLRCGLKNELADVDEPSRCEYVAVLSTPALCHEEKLKELQHKLDLLNSEQPRRHEEL